MIDPELTSALNQLEAKVDAVYRSAEKTRKYILWTVIGTVALFVLPLLFLPFAIGSLMSTYSAALSF